MITGKELQGMCEKLAYKFNNPDHREDMVQEGLLVCYELLALDPETHPAKLHREAKRRMHDYLNVDVHPVSIPAHSRTKRLARDIEDGDKGDMSDIGYAWLKSVLSAENMPYDEDFGESSYDHTQNYEVMEYNAHVLSVAVTTLDQDEWQVISMRYYDEVTQNDVADALGTNQRWVSRTEKRALEKLKSWLCNNS
jgi:RNA polymerase sigma factor (sigma-70 family)